MKEKTLISASQIFSRGKWVGTFFKWISGQVDKSKSGIILDNNCSYGRYLQIKTTIILAKPYLVSKSE
jgi:hypothetical protein